MTHRPDKEKVVSYHVAALRFSTVSTTHKHMSGIVSLVDNSNAVLAALNDRKIIFFIFLEWTKRKYKTSSQIVSSFI